MWEVETSAILSSMSMLLDDREVIRGVVDALRQNQRSGPALEFLIRFDDMNKALTGVVVASPERESMRRALARLVDALTRPEAFREVDVELETVHGLCTRSLPRPIVRPSRKLPVALLTVTLVGLAMFGFLSDQSSRSDLKESRAEIASLKDRLGEVANEKAQEQDEKEIATAVAAELAQIAAFAATLSSDLESCIDYTTLIARAAFDIGNGVPLSESYVDELIASTTATCAAARSNAADLRGYVDSLR